MSESQPPVTPAGSPPDPTGGEPPPPGMSVLQKRIITGGAAFAGVFALVLLAPQWMIGLVVLWAAAYGFHEYLVMQSFMLHAEGAPVPNAWVLMPAGILPALGALGGGLAPAMGGTLLAILWLVGAVWLRPGEGRERMALLGQTLAGFCLIAWPLAHLSLLAALPEGRGFLIFLMVTLTLNDTAAYTVGNLVGKTPLAPAISPNKTVEGSLGGLGGGLVGGLVGAVFLPGAHWSLLELLALGVVLAAAGQAGDLVESRLKRLFGVKDSGSLLPGHGGLLDRLDAFLLSTPLLYYILRIVGD